MRSLASYLNEDFLQGELLYGVTEDNFHEKIVDGIKGVCLDLWEKLRDNTKGVSINDDSYFQWEDVYTSKRTKEMPMALEVRQQVKDACIHFIDGMIRVLNGLDTRTCNPQLTKFDPRDNFELDGVFGQKTSGEFNKLFDTLHSECDGVLDSIQGLLKYHRLKSDKDPKPWRSFLGSGIDKIMRNRYATSEHQFETALGRVIFEVEWWEFIYKENTDNTTFRFKAGKGPLVINQDMSGMNDYHGNQISVGDIVACASSGTKFDIYRVVGSRDGYVITSTKATWGEPEYLNPSICMVVIHNGKRTNFREFIKDYEN